MIWRPRLVEALDAGVRRSVTLVCAGAGWGKTTLAASWAGARAVSGPIAWLSLDEQHNDPEAFWSDVLRALTTAGLRLPRSRPAVGELGFQRWIGDVLGFLPTTVVLVLDDVHRLDGRRVLGELGGLLRRAPGRLRFVLAGRREPGVSLHRQRVAGDLTEIGATDLAFRLEEAAELPGVRERGMATEDLAGLVRHVEGWPVGVRIALDGSPGPSPERIAEDYLLEEVFAGQPDDTRQFLSRTSVPDRVCGPLADALTGQQNGQRNLERLARANLFVEPVGSGGWYRYHGTFRSALRRRLRSTEPGMLPDLHLRAARWHAAAGGVLPALTHAAAAGDWQLLAGLVVDRGLPLFTSGDRTELIRILNGIPAARLSDSAELMVCAAVLAFYRGDPAATALRIAQARTRLGPSDHLPPTAVGIALGVLEAAVLVRGQGDMPRLLDLSTATLADVAAFDPVKVPAVPQYRTLALDNKAVALLWTGQLDHADRYLWASASGARTAGMPLVAASALGHLAVLDFLRGSVREAEEHLSSAIGIARRVEDELRPTVVPSYLARALVESERGRDIEAGEALRKALQAGGEVFENALMVLAALVRARLLVDRGEGRGARTVMREAWTEAGPGLVAPLLMRMTDLMEAEIDLSLGEPGRVLARYTGVRPTAPSEQLRLARAHLLAGHLDTVAAMTAAIRAGSDRVSAVTAYVLDAIVADMRGRGAAAGEALQRALTLAEPDRLRRPFLLVDPQRVLALAGRQQWLTELRGHTGDGLLGEITGELPVVTPSAGPLSERELDVLQYLPTMLTAGEIAENLNISINTVKAHMRAIYRKLGAGRRREAVVTARHLGLL